MSSSPDKKKLFDEISSLKTEARNAASMNIDTAAISEILKIINDEDKSVPSAVEKEIPYIEKAVELIVSSFKAGGRLVYFGAGTSGRLGVIDASECPPHSALILNWFMAILQAEGKRCSVLRKVQRIMKRTVLPML